MATILSEESRPDAATGHDLPFSEAVKVWARVAALSFGGPAGQIAVMHRIIVEEKRWIGDDRFLHALNYCTLLPGPEAQQLAIYIGWLLHKTKGALVAGTLFVLPGAVAIMGLSWIYAIFGNVGAVQALFFGLKAAVLAIVLGAVLRIGSRSLKNNVMIALAAAAFLALALFQAPFPLVVIVAGLIGFIGSKAGWKAFAAGGGHGKAGGKHLADADSLLGEGIPEHTHPNTRWLTKVAVVGGIAWFGPILLLFIFLGQHNVFSDISVFFSKMAMVTFGGAYAVLSYVAQEAVNHYGWLKPGEMLDGLGLAETTPGPLIMVTQFVGFLGAYRSPGGMSPLLAGTLGGLLTTWITFVPCFLWILLGGPFMETLRRNKALSSALSAITAAVVGIILNLALWFALHVLFSEVRKVDGFGMSADVPVLSSVNLPALVLTLAAVIAVFRFKMGMLKVLAACALAGLAYGLAFGVHP
ncbi:chromate efflux transporter [Agrobacterium tumefaciens]|uniref:chromate efflux transporter n=1 Tax=Agrobacterium tumefaciens TaxID=358 RepID=UPI00287DC880|nr:chromate efflux transporter [Agrobacterium tumefaciens]MDS7594387.1 chromate efflux transporter [Agrobacterium tumefaciens]